MQMIILCKRIENELMINLKLLINTFDKFGFKINFERQ